MRTRRFILTSLPFILLGFGPTRELSADPPAVAEKPAIDWKEDPVCRMVFFAVLEGLYTDGVSDEVVNSIVPPKKKGDESVKVSFVVQCPLCHPVYEAFAHYQSRPAFADADGSRSTFGEGIESELTEALKSQTTSIRLGALRVLVHRWVERRLTAMKLTESERNDWVRQLGERSNQGRQHLSRLIANDEDYRGWSVYWGCAACNGTTDACRALRDSN